MLRGGRGGRIYDELSWGEERCREESGPVEGEGTTLVDRVGVFWLETGERICRGLLLV